MTVSVPEYFLTSYDAYNTGVYILEEGAHYLTIADDAHAAANNILTVKGKTTADGMTADGDASMVYTEPTPSTRRPTPRRTARATTSPPCSRRRT